MAMTPSGQRLEQMITTNKLVIFGSSTCGKCKEIKKLLDDQHKTYFNVDLDTVDDAENLSRAIADKINGLESVPQVFVSGKHIGDGDALAAMMQKNEI